MTPIAKLTEFMVALEARLPPRRACHHVIYVEMGDTPTGKAPVLRLQLIGTYPPTPMYFSADDLEKDVDQLVAETVETIQRATDLILAAGRPA